jgi:hypothetical protein
MPKRYPQDQRERAVRMVLDHLSEYDKGFIRPTDYGLAFAEAVGV